LAFRKVDVPVLSFSCAAYRNCPIEGVKHIPEHCFAAWAGALDDAATDPAGLQRRKEESLRIAPRFDLGKITDAYERVLRRAAGMSLAEK
jgi:hypothetical protein